MFRYSKKIFILFCIFILTNCAYNTQLHKADSEFKKNNYIKAIELYEQAAKESKNDNIYTAAMLGLIDAYLKISDYKNAYLKIEELEKKINLDEPFAEWILYNRILSEFNLNLFVECFNNSSTFLRMYPKSPKFNNVKEYATLSMKSLGKTIDLAAITGAASETDLKKSLPDIKPIKLTIKDFYKDDFNYVVVEGITEPGALVFIDRDKAEVKVSGEFVGRTNFRYGRAIKVRAEKSATEFSIKELYDTEEPRKPQGLEGNVSGSTIRLRWNDNAEPDLLGYNVYFSLDNSTWEKVNRDNDFIKRNEYTFSRNIPGNAWVRITALDKMRNESEPSDTIKLP